MYEGIKEFAERTGFKYYSIRRLCMEGRLPCICIGRRRMIPVDDALESLKAIAQENISEAQLRGDHP